MPDSNDIVFTSHNFLGGFSDWFDFDAFKEFLSNLWDIYSIIAIILSIIFFLGYIYAKIRFEQLSAIEMDQLKEAEQVWAHTHGGESKANNKWTDITSHIASHNPSEWRIAILEADILLEDTLEKTGYQGNSVGERLKDAKTSPFNTIQDAWDAHKVRNDVAHGGSDFVLTKKMAQETIVKFERVFREFGVI